jgi:hypothetical protein
MAYARRGEIGGDLHLPIRKRAAAALAGVEAPHSSLSLSQKVDTRSQVGIGSGGL